MHVTHVNQIYYAGSLVLPSLLTQGWQLKPVFLHKGQYLDGQQILHLAHNKLLVLFCFCCWILVPGRTVGSNEYTLFIFKFNNFKTLKIFPSRCRIEATFMTDVQKSCNSKMFLLCDWRLFVFKCKYFIHLISTYKLLTFNTRKRILFCEQLPCFQTCFWL